MQGINHNSIIIFSDSAGNVFIRSKYAQNSLKPQLIHSFDTTYRDSVNLRYKEQSLSVTSRLTASEEYVYLCFGNQIWRCALPIQDVSSFEMIVSLDSNSLIKDIYYTEEKLFLNKGHEISIIDCDTCIEGISYTLEKKGLRHFTKFSPDINKNAVIVGVAAKDNDYSQLANFIVFLLILMKMKKSIDVSEMKFLVDCRHLLLIQVYILIFLKVIFHV